MDVCFEFNLHRILIVNSVSQFAGLNLLSAIYPKLNLQTRIAKGDQLRTNHCLFLCILTVKWNVCFTADILRLVCECMCVDVYWLSDGVWLQNNRFHFTAQMPTNIRGKNHNSLHLHRIRIGLSFGFEFTYTAKKRIECEKRPFNRIEMLTFQMKMNRFRGEKCARLSRTVEMCWNMRASLINRK